MPPEEKHEIKMMYAIYADGRKEPIVIDEIKDLSLEEAEPILEEHNFVKVTRCEDCKHSEYDGLFDEYWCDGRRVWEKHYCSCGELRDGKDQQ